MRISLARWHYDEPHHSGVDDNSVQHAEPSRCRSHELVDLLVPFPAERKPRHEAFPQLETALSEQRDQIPLAEDLHTPVTLQLLERVDEISAGNSEDPYGP